MKELSRFGPFALEGKLGEDSNSSVYRALHLARRRMVALKVFDAPLVSKNTAAKQALVAEMDRLTALKHWNIVACHGGLLEEMHGCIVYELVEGESLRELMNRRDRLVWESVVDYAYQIVTGLEAAHENGFVHEDLHPDKILIAEDGTVKVADLRVDRSKNPSCASSSHVTCERVQYRAPEQLEASPNVTAKSDLYALGCMMFEMLVGRPPFAGESVEAISRQKHEEDPPRVDSLLFECPTWLADVVAQLLEKEPGKRPYGARAVMAALHETTRQSSAAALATTPSTGSYAAYAVTSEYDATREMLDERQKDSDETNDGPPFYERAWFLALCLLLLVGGIGTWLLWPPSELSLHRRAVAIIESKEGIQREGARPHLEKLLRMYPNGEFAADAKERLRQLDMASAKRKFEFNVKYGREPKSEAERLYKEAWDFEQFGDRIAALEKYRSMVDVFADDVQETTQRAFVDLARQQIVAIEAEGSDDDRLSFIELRLQDADQLSSSGKELDAQKIWRGIIELYGNKPEFQTLVKRADDRLHPVADATGDS